MPASPPAPHVPKLHRGPSSGIHAAARIREKPMLASEALREDLAPTEPGRQQLRYWLLGIALALVGLGVAFRYVVGAPELRLQASTICFSAGGALAAAAVLPLGYALRAGVSLVVGSGLLVLGFRGAGPLSGIALDGGLLRDLTRIVTLTCLPAALLLRAHYRAYPLARWLLAAALVLSLPFVITEALLTLNQSSVLAIRVAAGINFAVVVCSLFGFTSSATSGGGSWWAMLVLFVVPIEIGLRELTPLATPEMGYLTYPATALGVQCAAMLVALGLFQLASAKFAAHARRTCLPSPRPDAPRPSSTSTPLPEAHPKVSSQPPAKALRETH